MKFRPGSDKAEPGFRLVRNERNLVTPVFRPGSENRNMGDDEVLPSNEETRSGLLLMLGIALGRCNINQLADTRYRVTSRVCALDPDRIPIVVLGRADNVSIAAVSIHHPDLPVPGTIGPKDNKRVIGQNFRTLVTSFLRLCQTRQSR